MAAPTDTLYVKLTNVKYPVDQSIMRQVFDETGGVVNITMIPQEVPTKAACIIRFTDASRAQAGMIARSGKNIFDGCNTMDINFAQSEPAAAPQSAPLLPNPVSTAAPAQPHVPYHQQAPPPQMQMQQQQRPPQQPQPGAGYPQQGGAPMYPPQQAPPHQHHMNHRGGRGVAMPSRGGHGSRGSGMNMPPAAPGMPMAAPGVPPQQMPQGIPPQTQMGPGAPAMPGMPPGGMPPQMWQQPMTMGGMMNPAMMVPQVMGPPHMMMMRGREGMDFGRGRGFGDRGGRGGRGRGTGTTFGQPASGPTEFVSAIFFPDDLPLQRLFELLEVFGGVKWIKRNNNKKNIMTICMDSYESARNVSNAIDGLPFYGHKLSVKEFPGFVQKHDIRQGGNPNEIETTEFDFTESAHRLPNDRVNASVGCTDTILLTGLPAGFGPNEVTTFFTEREYAPKSVSPIEGGYLLQFADLGTAVKVMCEYNACVCGEVSTVLKFHPSSTPKETKAPQSE